MIRDNYINENKYLLAMITKIDESLLLPDYNSAQKIHTALANKALYNILIDVDNTFGYTSPELHSMQKKLILEQVAQSYPLVDEILSRKILSSNHPTIFKEKESFICDVSHLKNHPITLFGIHEFLRAVRHKPQPADNEEPFFKIDGKSISFDYLHSAHSTLVHNTNLSKTHDKSYILANPLIPSSVIGLCSGYGLATGSDFTPLKIATLSSCAGLTSLLAIKAADRLQYGRKLNVTAPWNTELYLDTNLRIFADNPELLHMATRDTIPRPQILGIKINSFYYTSILELEDRNFQSNLRARYQAAKEKRVA